jgi:hypothetical protein
MDELRQRLERVLSDQTQSTSNSQHTVHSSAVNKGTLRRPILLASPKLTASDCLNAQSVEHSYAMKPSTKSTVLIGSTPLPRKQLQSIGTQSYRTIGPFVRQHQSQQMSKSFILSSKRDGNQIDRYESISSI